MAGWNLMGWGP